MLLFTNGPPNPSMTETGAHTAKGLTEMATVTPKQIGRFVSDFFDGMTVDEAQQLSASGVMAELKKTVPNIARVDRRELHRVLAGIPASAAGIVPAESFLYDRRNDGLILVEDVPRSITSVRDLELVPFLKGGKNRVNGEEMVLRARGELDANFGQHDAEWVFAHQHEIPPEFRKYYLVFPGTVWRCSDGGRLVPCLRWEGGRWILVFYWLRYDFDSDGRLVRPRK